MRPAEWQRTVARHFDFLLDHGFASALELAQTGRWGTSAVYRSKASAVEVTWSNEFDCVDVALLRLVDGGLPEEPIFFTEAAPMNRTLLESVVLAREPGREEEMSGLGGLGTADVERQLAVWASLLRDVAADFLDGAPGVFDEARAVIAARVAEHPQEIVVWLPHDATDDDEARAVAKAREGAPPEVAVVTRRYRRP